MALGREGKERRGKERRELSIHPSSLSIISGASLAIISGVALPSGGREGGRDKISQDNEPRVA